MNIVLLEVQQAGLGLIGSILVFFILIPLLSNIFKSKNDDKKP